MAEEATPPETEPADDAQPKRIAQLEKQVNDYKLLVAELQITGFVQASWKEHDDIWKELFARDSSPR